VQVMGRQLTAAVLSGEGIQISTSVLKTFDKKLLPQNFVDFVAQTASTLGHYDVVSVGFPAFICNGIILESEEFHAKQWKKYPLETQLSLRLCCAVRVCNNADFLALSMIEGRGFEAVLLLGKFVGVSLFTQGMMIPHFNLSLHPLENSMNYKSWIGSKALDKIGDTKWSKRVADTIAILSHVFRYDRLYLTGSSLGQLKDIKAKNITRVPPSGLLTGGVKLWEVQSLHNNHTTEAHIPQIV